MPMYKRIKFSKINKILKSEGGFVLIAAIIACVMLMALALLAMNLSTGDLRTTSSVVGEKRAFSAAESGVHQFCHDFDPSMLIAVNGQAVGNDNSLVFGYTAPQLIGERSLPGYDASRKAAVFETTVTGRDTRSRASVSITVGTAYIAGAVNDGSDTIRY